MPDRAGFVRDGMAAARRGVAEPVTFAPLDDAAARSGPASQAVRGRAGAAGSAGYAGGYAAGYAAGAREAARAAAQEAQRVAAERADERARVAAQQAEALAVLERAAQTAAARTAPVLAAAERSLQAAAVQLAEAVLGVELSDAHRSARAALTRVLDHPLRPQVQEVRLHPRDLAALHGAGVGASVEGLRLVADPSLAPGDAVGAHPDGYLDACIGTALERAVAALARVESTDDGG